MRKYLINLIALTTIAPMVAIGAHYSIISSIKSVAMKENNYPNPELLTFEQKAPLEDIVFESQNKYDQKRLYIDSSSDNDIPNKKDGNDITVNYAKRNEWYNHTISLGTINILDYSNSKDEFLKKIEFVKINTKLGQNFWNSKYGWDVDGGKNFAYKEREWRDIKLTGSSRNEILLEAKHNTNHATKEYVEFYFVEEWNGNQLSFKFKFCAKVTWSGGSIYHHAAIIGTKEEKVTLIKYIK